MAKMVKETIHANGVDIGIYTQDFENEYLSLTDIARYKSDDPAAVIQNWMRNRDVLEFLGLWEKLHNDNFNPLEFEGFRKQAGANAFTMSPKKWIETTSAIGMVSKAGRYGGTYAHSDIAMSFATWISPELTQWQISNTYASEADLLNTVLFGKTAKEWRDEKKQKDANIRDDATLNQLLVLANLESYNAILIEQGKSQAERMQLLHDLAVQQMRTLNSMELSELPGIEKK